VSNPVIILFAIIISLFLYCGIVWYPYEEVLFAATVPVGPAPQFYGGYVDLRTPWKAFIDDPEAILWFSLLGFTFSFAALSLLPVLRRGWSVRSYFRGWYYLQALLVCIMAGALIFASSDPRLFLSVESDFSQLALPHFEEKLSFISGAVVVMSLVPIGGIALVFLGAKVSESDYVESRPEEETYIRLKGYLQQSILIVGIILGLTMITTGALFELKGAVEIRDPRGELTILWGAYLSGLIAVVYVPADIRLSNYGRRIRARLFPLPTVTSDNLAEQLSRRKVFEDYLQLSITSAQSTQSIIAILVPMASGVVSFVG